LNITVRVLSAGEIVNIVEVTTTSKSGDIINSSVLVSAGEADPVPDPDPTPTPGPDPRPVPDEDNITNKTPNKISGHATMEKTGVPAIAMIMLLLAVFTIGLRIRKN